MSAVTNNESWQGTITGTVDPRFEPVREAFAENFRARGELGAGISIRIASEPVVDLTGGWADRDRRRPWSCDTLVQVWSIGKLITTICALSAIDRGHMGLDTPVASAWPEFATQGKSEITMRDVLAHQAGLPALRSELPAGASADWTSVTRAIADQAPWWQPGTRHGYHVNTFGFIVGELLARTTGRSIQRLVSALAAQFELDLHVGLEPKNHARAAEFELWPMTGGIPPSDGMSGDDLMTWMAYFNPPDLSGIGVVNEPWWREAAIPSTNPFGTAHSLAELLVQVHGRHRLVSESLLAEATTEHSHGPDAVLGATTRFGLGFQLHRSGRLFGPGESAFGHYGAGGSVAMVDPAADLVLAYVTNRAASPAWISERNQALIDATYEALGASPKPTRGTDL